MHVPKTTTFLAPDLQGEHANTPTIVPTSSSDEEALETEHKIDIAKVEEAITRLSEKHNTDIANILMKLNTNDQDIIKELRREYELLKNG